VVGSRGYDDDDDDNDNDDDDDDDDDDDYEHRDKNDRVVQQYEISRQTIEIHQAYHLVSPFHLPPAPSFLLPS